MMAHPPTKADHEMSRAKVCSLCGCRSSQIRKVTPSICLLVKEHVNGNYDISDPHYPTGICNTCRVVLSKYAKGDRSRPLPEMPSYENITLLKDLRYKDDETCNCFICITARSTAISKGPVGGRGKKRSISPTIKTGLVAAQRAVSVPKIRKEPTGHDCKVRICSKCHAQIGRGIKHQCKIANTASNILNSIESMPDKVAQQVASGILKKKADSIAGNTRNVSLQLSTKGVSARVVLNPISKEPTVISHESLHDLQIGIGNQSSTRMRKVSNWVRTHVGRSSIPPGYDKARTAKSNILSCAFNVKKDQEFDGNGDAGKVTRPVVYADCKSIINRICAERDYAGTPNVIIMADGGGKFFKVCATILPQHYDWTLDKQLVADAAQSLVSSMKKKRSTYAEGGSLKKGKLTGVKRVILLAVVPDIKETHSNISVIFELIGLNNIAFKIVSDFKLQLLVLGLQTATATHPCGYCFISQSELKKRKIEAV